MTRSTNASSRASGRRAARRAPARNPWPNRIAILIGAASVVLVVGAIIAASLDPTPDQGDPGAAPVGEITCDRGEHFTYHVHAHLAIRVDGSPVGVPPGIGVVEGRCIYWLHTHSADGVIHVEAPAQRDFSLGEFFDVWRQPLSPTQVGPTAVGDGRQVFAFVDGQRFDDDPRTIVLENHRTVELQIGTEPLEPQAFTFPPGL